MAGTYSDGVAGDTLAYAARDSGGLMTPFTFTRQPVGPKDVAFDILFCGVCHSDIHITRSEWATDPTEYPCVPGHELVGKVTAVGAEVTNHKVGDSVGVGVSASSSHIHATEWLTRVAAVVNSCRQAGCRYCPKSLEQFCTGSVFTYNSKLADGRITFGGYSDKMVCDESFVLKMPANLPLDAAAPILCAGITVYAPMVSYGLNKPGMKIGVMGMGGLGSFAVQFAAAFGCVVTVISTSASKEAEAKALGAKHFLLSKDAEAMKAAEGTFEGIVDTVSADHDIGAVLDLLEACGKLVLVGIAPGSLKLKPLKLIGGNKQLCGSLIGGIAETQACLNFCAKHNIKSNIELIPIDYINTAYERVLKQDIRGRFVIDMASLKTKA